MKRIINIGFRGTDLISFKLFINIINTQTLKCVFTSIMF